MEEDFWSPMFKRGVLRWLKWDKTRKKELTK